MSVGAADSPQAAVGMQERYFTPAEVELHNAPEDCWLSWLGNVYDVQPLIDEHKGDPLLVPIIKNAGKDISHWFDKKTGDLKTQTNPLTKCVTPYTPEGRFLHVPPPFPQSDWALSVDSESGLPWWLDKETYCIGRLSQKTRSIRVINTLTRDEHILEVASEEKLAAVQDRYLAFNSHAKGYMWKRQGQLLDMSRTLEENGLPEESAQFELVGMDADEWLPAVHLYFSDDLTVA
ncbi:Cytochrome b5 domain-containing protein 1 [Geranomyces variabilis]|uniref:Cytochrome b5 domain-containing protein 1 n=1 Tax=Geranomyces variabilis TaxID=109894 RepID=A0AAD5XRP8_9FUNG|nr:Cytochrome b5 domain-containing protein 1 [Geranomyces variabilis]